MKKKKGKTRKVAKTCLICGDKKQPEFFYWRKIISGYVLVSANCKPCITGKSKAEEAKKRELRAQREQDERDYISPDKKTANLDLFNKNKITINKEKYKGKFVENHLLKNDKVWFL